MFILLKWLISGYLRSNPGLLDFYFLVEFYSFYSFCQEKSSYEICLNWKACYIEILLDRIAAGNIKIINIFRY